MRFRELGQTGLQLTELGFGAAPIAGLYEPIDADVAAATVDAAWAAGVRFFDTAPHYGLGLSEQRLGASLRRHPRAEYVVSTKVGRRLVPNPQPTGSDLAVGGFAVPDHLTRVPDYSADGVHRSLEASLDRLGLDRVDIVFVHDPDDIADEAVAETVATLASLRDQGVIAAVGVGSNHWQPTLALLQRTDLDVVLIAGRWTLADRSAEPLLSACERRGVALVAAAPFNSGLLANPRRGTSGRFDYVPASEEQLVTARALAATCHRHGADLAQAALQFPLRRPVVTSTVAGFRSDVEVRQAQAWLSQDVDPRLWDDIDRELHAAVAQ